MTILVGYTRTAEGHAALQHGIEAAATTGKPLSIFPLADRGSVAVRDGDVALDAALAGGASLIRRPNAADNAAEDLLDAAAEHGVGLIVIGVRTRSRVSKMLLGSDAQNIILGSSVPVLTVKAASNEH